MAAKEMEVVEEAHEVLRSLLKCSSPEVRRKAAENILERIEGGAKRKLVFNVKEEQLESLVTVLTEIKGIVESNLIGRQGEGSPALPLSKQPLLPV